MSTKKSTIPTPQQRKERTIENYLVKRVKEEGGDALKLEIPGRVGWPDRLCVMPNGVTMFVECKTTTGVLSKGQELRIGWLKNRGHLVEVVFKKEDVDVVILMMKNAMIYNELRGHIHTKDLEKG